MTEIFRASRVRGNQGFTLIEMAIVCVISGLILSVGMQAYTIYMSKKSYDETYARVDAISDGINDFYTSYGRFPCPADPALPENDPNFGYESDCTVLKAAATPSWTGGIHKVLGARDTLADLDTAKDAVYIGAVPFMALKRAREMTGVISGTGADKLQCLKVGQDPTLASSQIECDANSDAKIDAGVYRPQTSNASGYDKAHYDTMYDAYGFKFTYAVTENLTDKSSFDPAYGAIDVETAGGISLATPQYGAHYVIVSHGANHMGAYTASGNKPSTVGVPCVTGTKDYENCNSDSTFVEEVLSLGKGVDYYDDIVKHSDYSLAQLWAFNGTNIYNVNMGNVGIGTATPTQELEVTSLDADTTKGSVRATNARQKTICDGDGNNCWDPDNFGGSTPNTGACSQSGVPANSAIVMTGIKNGKAACTPTILPLPIVIRLQSCPSGTFAKGVSSLGTLICGTP